MYGKIVSHLLSIGAKVLDNDQRETFFMFEGDAKRPDINELAREFDLIVDEAGDALTDGWNMHLYYISDGDTITVYKR